jgi:hypothetical protein
MSVSFNNANTLRTTSVVTYHAVAILEGVQKYVNDKWSNERRIWLDAASS